MTWAIEFSETSLRALKKLDRSVSKRIIRYMRDVSALDDPRTRGKALTGPLSGLWRYRVGDYRVVSDIRDETVTIYAIDVDHRSRVYDS
ncbi:type II toxin-antitoxin system RelE/ParE family toxin [Kocuria rhizophila]|uniref:type II toxin-antitoxin system RelE family toxin n=1 Tax=Kocuria rhizophila TaxID=72000 RepID=UPI001ADAA936|nr:type II toxin-antitoxin system RelE/ParE family toxin [Kocuria rhizophila]MDN3225958.1 type II toxin-antitoxin system RelE/ParE family toxin [Kocuria rhizophila]QTK31511.1 type II toxin-antitoxin system RelE/ParE family toxin [Kocuria rhizophila]WSQ06138.1 type II toxin-antitoxin system RelE/ParE family toxin [Kocuria rhizophila]